MKNALLTVDVEEWHHLEYINDHEEERKKAKMVPAILNLLDLLDQYNIKAVFFILADIADEYYDIISEIKDRGHEIGCHGYDHELLHDMGEEQFLTKAGKAKEKLDNLLGPDVVLGYRASCFSLNRRKLDILQDLGYVYDSSFIRFCEHPLYGKMDMSGYKKMQSLVYLKDGFYEFEIPTLKILKYNIPISGGGYMRFFPLFLIKTLITIYGKSSENILFYLHPFELTDIQIPFPEDISLKDRLRASIGRKKNMTKLEKLIIWLLKSGTRFNVPSALMNETAVVQGGSD